MDANGLQAYKTFLGMSLHFKKGAYCGWDYNFNGKCKPETFEANRQLKYQYAAIERDFPDKLDQIMYFYPAFAKFGYVQPKNVRGVAKAYKEFDQEFSFYEKELRYIGSQTRSIDELIGLDGSLPFLYNAYLKSEVSLDFLIVLSLVIPSVLKIKSQETILWKKVCDELKFHREFYRLYIKDMDALKQKSILILKEVWFKND